MAFDTQTQITEDLKSFYHKFGQTRMTCKQDFPTFRSAITRKANSLGIKNPWIDHPRVWMADGKIICCTASYHNCALNDEFILKTKSELETLIGNRYSIEIYQADDVNCYFDKYLMGRCYRNMNAKMFRNECLSKHCTLILIPKWNLAS